MYCIVLLCVKYVYDSSFPIHSVLFYKRAPEQCIEHVLGCHAMSSRQTHSSLHWQDDDENVNNDLIDSDANMLMMLKLMMSLVLEMQMLQKLN